MASWRPLPGVARSCRALTVSPVELSCRRYQPRGVYRALPWRAARRRSWSRMVVGVRGGCSGSWGGLAGRAVEVLRVHVDVWVVLGGLGWARRCRVVPRVKGGPWGVVVACAGRVLRCVAFWGASLVSWRPVDGEGGVCGARSRLVDFWVMHGIVVQETQHVFAGGGVGELLRLCQQEVFAVYHLDRCSADCF